MSKALPWSIKGVDFDAREAAKEAARRSGMSLGDWLNNVIADRAAEMGVDEDEFDVDDRMDAVALRLQRLRDRQDERPRRGARPARRAPEEDDRDAWEAPAYEGPAQLRRRIRDRLPAREAYYDAPRQWSRGHDPEALLDRAVEAFDQRASEAQARTQRALAGVTRKLAEIEGQVARRAEPDPRRDARPRMDETDRNDPIARLEGKVAAILDTLNRPSPPPLRVVPPPVPPPAAPRAAATARPVDDAIAEIARRQRDLDGAAPPRRSLRDQLLSRAGAPDRAIERSVEALQTEIAGLAARLDDMRLSAREAPSQTDIVGLAARIDDVRRTTQQAPSQEDIAGLAARIDDVRRTTQQAPSQNDIAALTARIEEMRRDTQKVLSQTDMSGLAARFEEIRREASKSPSQDDLERLRREVSDLARGLGDLDPRRSMSALEAAMQDLARRVETLRDGGDRGQLLAPIEAIASDLRLALSQIDPRSHLSALEEGVRAMARKLESLRAPSLDSAAFDRLERQTGEIRALLADVTTRPQPVEKLERQIAALADRLDKAALGGGAGRADVEAAVADIRAVISNARPDDAFRKVDSRLEQLSAKLDEVLRKPAAPAPAASAAPGAVARVDTSNLERMLRSMSDKIDAVRAPENPAALERVMQNFTQRIEDTLRQPRVDATPDTAGLEQTVRALADRIETLRPQQADAKALEAVMRALADKIEAVQAPQVEGQALEALERQVAALASRIEKAGPPDGALAALERSMGDIFVHLEEMRNVTVDAAEAAARSAVSHALERAPAAAPAADLTRELSELRNRYDTADRRAQSTLTAVHDTLEKVVGRMAMLEEEVAQSARQQAIAPAPPAARMPAAEPRSAAPQAPAVAPSQPATRPSAPAQAAAQAPLHDDDFLIDPVGRPEPKISAPRPDAPRAAPASEPAEADDGKSAQANFIAAARRAAQAAVRESQLAEVAKTPGGAHRSVGPKTGVAAVASAGAGAAGKLAQLRTAFEARRKPVVLGLSALVTLAIAYQLLGPAEPPPPAAPRAPQAAPKAPPPRVEPAPQSMAPQGMAPQGMSAQGMSAQEMAPQAMSPQGQPPQGVAPQGAPPQAAAPAPAQLPAAAPAAPPGKGARVDSPDMAPVGALAPAGGLTMSPTAGLTAIRDAAGAGAANAQYELASRFADGRGVNRDMKAAAQWFEKAAAQGLAPAQYRLGSLYEKGLGVSRDAVQARIWYMRAAERGNARAMHNLAVLTAEGVDGKPDYNAAAQWFRRGAELGVRDSQFNLAILYARGLGVQQSLVHSYAWFDAAAAQGDADAGKKRDEVAGRLGNADLAAARAMAAAYKPRQPDAAGNDVPVPVDGWEALQKAPTTTPGGPTRRPAKVSSL
jgi:localization factor PodJL